MTLLPAETIVVYARPTPYGSDLVVVQLDDASGTLGCGEVLQTNVPIGNASDTMEACVRHELLRRLPPNGRLSSAVTYETMDAVFG